MQKSVVLLSLTLLLVTGLVACSHRPHILSRLPFSKVTTFKDVYPILENNCNGCHVEGGAASASWSLDREPVDDLFKQCRDIKDIRARHQCTTHVQLTAGDYPLVQKKSLDGSMPFVNACDPNNSFHIGSSIPNRLSDDECNTLGNWIMQGCPLEKPKDARK